MPGSLSAGTGDCQGYIFVPKSDITGHQLDISWTSAGHQLDISMISLEKGTDSGPIVGNNCPKHQFQDMKMVAETP